LRIAFEFASLIGGQSRVRRFKKSCGGPEGVECLHFVGGCASVLSGSGRFWTLANKILPLAGRESFHAAHAQIGLGK
jgi:hypothetical protein